MSSSWASTPLADVLTPVSRAVAVQPKEEYKLLGVRLDGVGPFLRETKRGEQSSATKLYKVEAGDFIYSRLFAWRGAFGVIGPELDGCFVSNEFPTFKPVQNKLDLSFLNSWFRLRSTLERVEANCAGSTPLTRNRYKEAFLLKLEIPLPPLSEQRRIVGRLEHLASKIEEARGLRVKVEKEIGALLASVFDQSLLLQNHWRELEVSEICEKPQYGYTASATSQPIGPRMLRITDIQNGKVDWSSVPFCDCTEPRKYLLKENDILIARTGGTTGKSFLISQKCPESVFASYLIRLRVKKLVTPQYLYKYFQSPSYWTQIIDELSGTGQPNVNGKKLAAIRVPVPPLHEQHQIVEKLDDAQAKVDNLQQLQAQTRAELDALLPSVLDKAFRGEL